MGLVVWDFLTFSEAGSYCFIYRLTGHKLIAVLCLPGARIAHVGTVPSSRVFKIKKGKRVRAL